MLSGEDDFRTKRRRTRHFRGRVWLTGIFLLFPIPSILLFLHAEKAGVGYLFGISLVLFLWMTGLLVCLWRRASWARYSLIMLLPMAATIAGLTAIVWTDLATVVRLDLASVTITSVLAAILLAQSEDVKNLSSRIRD